MNLNYREALRATNRPLFLPGDPEPEWLYRKAEHQRLLAQARRQERADRRPRLHRRLAARLRLAGDASSS